MDLNLAWYILVGVLLTGYAVLDGFDLGVGILHPLARTNDERRVMMNAIAPVWDGNEVWLVTGGGALFAAFPEAYATVFSGFYEAFMLFLALLIGRAVSLEFRGKVESGGWRRLWDSVFFVTSLLAAVVLGVALGNVLHGIPLDAAHEYRGTFLGLFGLFPVLLGLTTAALFAVHGACYLMMKTTGELRGRVRTAAGRGWWILFACLVVLTAVTFLKLPHMRGAFSERPWLVVAPVLAAVTLAGLKTAVGRDRAGVSFLFSALLVGAIMALAGIGLYPNVVLSTPDPANSLTIWNAASSAKTLGIMLVIAGVGMPVVIGYTIFIYRVFRGPVKIDETSY